MDKIPPEQDSQFIFLGYARGRSHAEKNMLLFTVCGSFVEKSSSFNSMQTWSCVHLKSSGKLSLQWQKD